MARFIEVTVGGSSRFLNVDSIAELEQRKDGTYVTMLWSREPDRQTIHFVKESPWRRY